MSSNLAQGALALAKVATNVTLTSMGVSLTNAASKLSWETHIQGEYALLFPKSHKDYPTRIEVEQYVQRELKMMLIKHHTTHPHYSSPEITAYVRTEIENSTVTMRSFGTGNLGAPVLSVGFARPKPAGNPITPSIKTTGPNPSDPIPFIPRETIVTAVGRPVEAPITDPAAITGSDGDPVIELGTPQVDNLVVDAQNPASYLLAG